MSQASVDTNQLTREFENKFLSFNNVFALGVTVFVQGFCLYKFVWHSHHTAREFLSWLGLAVIVTFPQFLLWFSYKRRFFITHDRIILKQIDKTIAARWDEIKRIEDVWNFWGGSRAFYVRTPHGTMMVPDTIKHCDELLAIIQERSGKRIISEWRGAKETIREDWFAFLRWIQTHRAEFLVILLIIGTVITLATRWAINEYHIYHPGR